MISKRGLILCLVLGLAILGLRFVTKNHSSKEGVIHEQMGNSPLGQPRLTPLATKHTPLMKILSSTDLNSTSGETAEFLLNEINPTNDWLVTYQPNEEKMLINQLLTAGVEFNGHIPELAVFRFSVVDPVKALPIIEELFDRHQVGINMPLRQPLPPRSELVFEDGRFSSFFIQWMGGEKQRDGYGQGVKVAVIDSGVDSSHPALSGVMIQHIDLLHESPPSIISASNAHGTAIASVISSQVKEYTGIAPGSSILSYRVIDESGTTDSYKVASAIVSAVKDGADVINLSLGGEEASIVLEKAVSFAIDNDVPIVAAVGNDGFGLVNYPAAYEGVFGVTSVGSNGRVSNFANYGEGVDFAAPGTGILTAWEASEMGYFSGTSVSAAMVTGAIAMELSRQPDLSVEDLGVLLKKFSNEAEQPGFDNLSGHGILSLSRLEQRGNPSFSDPALVGYHFENLIGHGTGTLPFQVILQNQGNTWLDEATLHVNYLGMDKIFLINNLGPGEIRTEKLYLQRSEFDNTLQISSHIRLPAGLLDNRLENNERSSVIKF